MGNSRKQYKIAYHCKFAYAPKNYRSTIQSTDIKRFVANALWSEYSAQFDDANYPIDEDTFIKTAKTFVKPQLIRDIEDYDFA